MAELWDATMKKQEKEVLDFRPHFGMKNHERYR
jgi:hypothetical protein